jgi:hypothetical protein
VLEVGSGPQVPTFHNSTYLDLQVGLTRDLGTRQNMFDIILIWSVFSKKLHLIKQKIIQNQLI